MFAAATAVIALLFAACGGGTSDGDSTDTGAKFFTVTFNTNGGSSILPKSGIASGVKINAPSDPTKSGFVFGGWYKEEAFTNRWDFAADAVTAAITLYAKWVAEGSALTVTFNSNGGTAVAPLTVESGDKITAPAAPTKAGGFTFDGWYKEATLATPWNFSSDTVTASIILYAKWSGEGYTGPWMQMDPDPGTAAIPVTLDPAVTYQTIEGFGFFGAMSPWWDGYWYGEEVLYTDAWAELVIGDLGITMWRNDVYPHNPIGTANLEGQDANWPLQKPVVQGLVRTANELGVDLKIILTVWSPPPAFKNTSSVIGGYVTSDNYTDFANWLISALDLYHDEIGHDAYALSFQNEPDFVTSYNSGKYESRQYWETLNAITPLIKAKYPNVKLFGSEHMLKHEGSGRGWGGPWYSVDTVANGNNLDVFALHGYDDGLLATDASEAGPMWARYREEVWADNPKKQPIWMTETSGYIRQWISGPYSNATSTWTMPGAFRLAQMIGTALKNGQLSAWVYWAGHEPKYVLDDHPVSGGAYSLFQNMEKDKRYYVSRHFYRYIRPGAKMTEVTCNDPDLLVIPFSHPEEKRFTVVVLNDSDDPKKLSLYGSGLGSQFMMYQTTEANAINCLATRLNEATPNTIVVPGKSIVTLVNSIYNP
jgi:uncharacterized repeat protein (TIGR02543 family)